MKLFKVIMALVTIGIFLLSCKVCSSHYIVFEDVGQVATSLTYLHVTIPLNFTDIDDLILQYRTAILDAKKKVTHVYKKDMNADHYKRLYWDDNFLQLMRDHEHYTKKALDDMLKLGDRLAHKRRHLSDIMPMTSTAKVDQFQATKIHFRRRRFLLPLLLRGVFGTFMGLYNRRQQKRLQTEMQSTIKEQKRLVEITRSNSQNISVLQTQIADLKRMTAALTISSPVAVVMKAQLMEREICDEIDRVTDAVQTAQLRRLSPLLLSGPQLRKLYAELTKRAENLQANLLLENPSDLFQIEVSYIYDGEESNDVTLILHVPMAQKRAILRLFRFLPFPLPFSDTHFLVPRPHHNLFAISSNEPRLSIDLTEADLEGCYKVSNVHLCERLGVLRTGHEGSCLGSLYAQQFKNAMARCQMDVVPISEQVLQLTDNWFLIYSTVTFTAQINCLNLTASEHHLKIGMNKLPVSPTCQLRLNQHVVFADTSLKVENQIKQIQWNLEDIAFSDAEVSEAAEVLEQISAEGSNHPTLADVRQHSAQLKKFPKWKFFFILLGLLLIFLLFFWIFCYISTHRWIIVRNTIRLISNFIWPPRPDAVYEAPGESDASLDVTAPPEPPPHSQSLAPLPPAPRPSVIPFLPSIRRSLRSRSQPPALPSVFARSRLQPIQ